MKSTTFALLASATLVMAQPKILNTADEFVVEAGKPFEIKYSGCDEGCTITIENGPSGNLKPVATLSTSATGDSLTLTIPEDLNTDKYAFRIVNNDTKEQNFSTQFDVEGTAPATTSAPASTSATPTSSAETESETSTESESTTETSASVTTVTSATTLTSVTSKVSTHTTPHATTSAPSTSSEEEETRSSTSAPASTTTTIPDSGASGVQAQLGLILAAAAAVAYL